VSDDFNDDLDQDPSAPLDKKTLLVFLAAVLLAWFGADMRVDFNTRDWDSPIANDQGQALFSYDGTEITLETLENSSKLRNELVYKVAGSSTGRGEALAAVEYRGEEIEAWDLFEEEQSEVLLAISVDQGIIKTRSKKEAVLVSRRGISGILGFIGTGLICGLGVLAWARARRYQEIALGSLAALGIQGVVWLYRVEWNPARFIDLNLMLGKLSKDPTVIQGNAMVMLMLMCMSFFVAALVGGLVGHVILEQATGKGTCSRCGGQFPMRPKPPAACPQSACGADLPHNKVRWEWVLGTAVLGAILYALTVKMLGESQGFFIVDNIKSPGTAAEKAIEAINEGEGSHKAFIDYGGGKGSLLLVNGLLYTAITSLPMLLAPAAMAWFEPRQVKRAILPLTLLTWLASTLMLQLYLVPEKLTGLVFLPMIQQQALVAIPWIIAFFVGAAFISNLRSRGGDVYLDDLDDE
jgi:hypothetical protein